MDRTSYVGKVEKNTGKTVKQFVALARKRKYGSDVKPGILIAWLKEEYGVGHGHALAMAHAIMDGLQ